MGTPIQQVLAVAAGSAGLTLAVTPLVGWAARSAGLVDVPNARKVHRKPVPRVGGVAIGAATLSVLAVAYAAHRGAADWGRLLPLLVGSAAVWATGVADDLFEVRSTYKLLALVAAGLAFCATGGAVQHVVVHGRTVLDLGAAAWPVTVLWIVTVTVSVNFIDGLDGLAAGIVAVAAAVLAVGAAAGGCWPVAVVGVALAGSLAAFLVYNAHPASIFMGDGGSMFVGFLLAAGSALAGGTVGTVRGLVLPAVALSIPLVDTALTMVRRGVLDRQSLFAAERGHVHHKLMDTGLGHRHAVLLLHGVTVAGAGVGLVCIFAGGAAAVAAAAAFGCGLTVMFRAARSVRARDTVAALRRNRAIGRENHRYLAAYHDAQLRFREARTVDGWWEQLCRAADGLDFAKVDVPLVRRDGSAATLRWRRAGGEGVADAGSVTAEVPVPQRRPGPALRARVEVTVDGFLETAGQRVALFSRLVAEFGLDQLPGGPAGARTPASAAGDAAAAGPFAGLRVAVVHDFLYTYGGAERVLEQVVRLAPHADLFALFDFLPAGGRGFIAGKPVRTSFLQRMPFARRFHRAYLPLMPLAVEQLDVSGYDLVISSSYVAAKGVLTKPGQLHVCYCHTPVRFAWDLQKQYLGQAGLARGVRSALARAVLHYVRGWDRRSAQGVDVFLANSDFVGRRVRKLYGRESTTVYPPVDTDAFTPGADKDDHYVTASRLVPYKRVDLIVEAFAAMPHRRLVVIGDGPEMGRAKAKAGPNVTFLGHASAADLRRHVRSARAFVFAAEEDFGIAPVEAQACGTPVVAYGRGGATETVVDGVTGVLFAEQTVASLSAAIDRFETLAWDPAVIRRQAERFSAAVFRRRFADLVARAWAESQAGRVADDRARRQDHAAADRRWDAANPDAGVAPGRPGVVGR